MKKRDGVKATGTGYFGENDNSATWCPISSTVDARSRTLGAGGATWFDTSYLCSYRCWGLILLVDS